MQSPQDSQQSPPKTMISLATQPQACIFTGTWDHRPSVSSPLSSSPIRPTDPLSPLDSNTVSQRQVQSSPIQPLKFKFASRPTRPNPVVRKRERAQEDRRRNFLQAVKQKSEDKAWQRRDIERQSFKNSWLAHVAQFSQNSPNLSETDIEDAVAFSRESDESRTNEEDMVMDNIPEEDEELEAMIASFEEQKDQKMPQTQQHDDLIDMVDDDQYEDVFAELVSRECQSDLDPIYMDHDAQY